MEASGTETAAANALQQLHVLGALLEQQQRMSVIPAAVTSSSVILRWTTEYSHQLYRQPAVHGQQL